jgi:hypothetical protein
MIMEMLLHGRQRSCSAAASTVCAIAARIAVAIRPLKRPSRSRRSDRAVRRESCFTIPAPTEAGRQEITRSLSALRDRTFHLPVAIFAVASVDFLTSRAPTLLTFRTSTLDYPGISPGGKSLRRGDCHVRVGRRAPLATRGRFRGSTG